MPTYEYACKDCGRHLEVVQSFKDEALTVCPTCDGPLRKVFGSIGIAFKGSGFYKTDSRGSSSSSSTTSTSTTSDAKPADAPKTESKPAGAKPAESKPSTPSAAAS